MKKLKAIKKYMETNENENSNPKSLGCNKSSSKSELHIAIQAYLKKQEKSQIDHQASHLK